MMSELSFISNPNFTVRLYVGEKFWVGAFLPDNYSFSIQNEYDSPFEINLDFINKISQVEISGESIASSFGIPQPAFIRQYIWKSTSNPEIDLDLNFKVITNDGFNDVFLPIIKLMSIALPTVVRNETTARSILANEYAKLGVQANPDNLKKVLGVIFPPGIHGKIITIEIGSMFRFKDIVVSSISSVFDTVLDDKGFPISGRVSLRFISRGIFDRNIFHSSIRKRTGINVN